MNNWIEALQDRRLKERADEEMQWEKHKLAVQSTPALADLLKKQIEGDVCEFQKRFTGDRIELVSPSPSGADVRVRTQRFPLRMVEYKVGEGQLQYLKFYQKSCDAQLASDQKGTVLIKADFNGSRWFEHQGEKILTVPELSSMLLAEVFEDASLP